METNDDEQDDVEAPDISNWLLSFLSSRRGEYEEQYATGESSDAESLERALSAVQRTAAEMLSSGVIPAELTSQLDDFLPGEGTTAKVRELLGYRIVHHRLEFDVAEAVCDRLAGLDKRIAVSAVTFTMLMGYAPTPKVLKYYGRVADLFLAGYEAEVFLMAGAVVEAALNERISNEMLTEAGFKPVFARTGEFAIAQRIAYADRRQLLSPFQLDVVRDINNWRNDVAHVMPDVTPKPVEVLIRLAMLLPTVLPGSSDGLASS